MKALSSSMNGCNCMYQKGDESVGFLWGRAEQALTLAAAEGLS